MVCVGFDYYFPTRIRRGLEHLGRGYLFGRRKKSNPSEIVVGNLATAIQYTE